MNHATRYCDVVNAFPSLNRPSVEAVHQVVAGDADDDKAADVIFQVLFRFGLDIFHWKREWLDIDVIQWQTSCLYIF